MAKKFLRLLKILGRESRGDADRVFYEVCLALRALREPDGKLPKEAREILRELVDLRIADVKAYGPPSDAREWQRALRETFQAAFDAGFVAVGFSRTEPHQPRYLLERTA